MQAHALTEDEQIEAALAILEQAQPTPPAPAAAPTALQLPELHELPSSPTLAGLDASRHPQLRTVCEVCPNSVWFASPAEVKCYCRVMFLITWSTQEPNQMTACDGALLGQE